MIREGIRQSVFGQNRVHLYFMIAGHPQDLHHFSDRALIGIVPTDHFDDHLLTIFTAVEIGRRNEEVGMEALVRRVAKRVFFDLFQHNHILLAQPFHHA